MVRAEGKAQAAFVVCWRGLNDAHRAGCAIISGANDGRAAIVIAADPFGDQPSIAQLRLFVRRAKIHDGLIKGVVANPAVPVNASRAAGEEDCHGNAQDDFQGGI